MAKKIIKSAKQKCKYQEVKQLSVFHPVNPSDMNAVTTPGKARPWERKKKNKKKEQIDGKMIFCHLPNYQHCCTSSYKN